MMLILTPFIVNLSANDRAEQALLLTRHLMNKHGRMK